MNADEIVRALKSNAEVNHHAAVMMMAADLIEHLQAQLTASQARERAAANELCDCCKSYARAVSLKTDCLNCQWRSPQDDEVKQ